MLSAATLLSYHTCEALSSTFLNFFKTFAFLAPPRHLSADSLVRIPSTNRFVNAFSDLFRLSRYLLFTQLIYVIPLCKTPQADIQKDIRLPFSFSTKEHRLDLFPPQGSIHRFRKLCKIGNERCWLIHRIILPKGHKRAIPIRKDTCPPLPYIRCGSYAPFPPQYA